MEGSRKRPFLRLPSSGKGNLKAGLSGRQSVSGRRISVSGQSAAHDLRFWDGSASLESKGRADGKPENLPIPAGCFSFRPDEPEREDNLARSSHVRLKHAQDKSCGLTAVIQSRNRRCSRLRTARSDCLSSRRSRKSMVLWALFHVKHHPDRPHSVPFQCAPETLPEASTTASVRQTFVCARVRPHFGGQAGLALCSGSFRPQSERVRGDRSIYRLKNRAAFPSQRKRSHPKNSDPAPHPIPRPYHDRIRIQNPTERGFYRKSPKSKSLGGKRMKKLVLLLALVLVVCPVLTACGGGTGG